MKQQNLNRTKFTDLPKRPLRLQTRGDDSASFTSIRRWENSVSHFSMQKIVFLLLLIEELRPSVESHEFFSRLLYQNEIET